MKRSQTMQSNPQFKKQKKFSTPDPRLVAHIKQYLLQNSHLKVINVDSMADYLQTTYREHSRKKRKAFQICLQRVCDSLNLLPSTPAQQQAKLAKLEMKHIEKIDSKNGDESSSSSSSSSDSDVIVASSSEEYSENNESYTVYQDTNMMNNSLSNMYKKSPWWNDEAKVASYVELSDGEANGDKSINVFPVTPKVLSKSTKCVTLLSTPSTSKSTKQKHSIESVDEKIENAIRNKVERRLERSSVRFEDIGGCESTLQEVIKLLIHLKHAVVHQTLGIMPPRGFLLHGPPGCGKTLLVHALAGELELPFIKVAATEMVSGVSGDSEKRIRELFERAVASAPCVLFIDEIDAITPKRETAHKEMERRIVSQLLTCLDDLNLKENAQVLVIGATNRPDSLDPALRRAGRFDREIKMGIPDQTSRIKILQVLCRKLKLVTDFDYTHLARQTPGFVGADLGSLVREAAMIAVDRILKVEKIKIADETIVSTTSDKITVPVVPNETAVSEVPDGTTVPIVTDGTVIPIVPTQIVDPLNDIGNALNWLRDKPPLSPEQLENLYIEMKDFEEALKVVQPSAMREGFATIPGVTWDDVGALKEVREELQMAILAPVQHPELFLSLNITSPPGILLCGPPGCGKTLLAKAVANESGVNFISVKGPELLNMYVGESERAVRQVFQRAQNSAPCVIFFDELDALCPNRTDSGEGGASVRVVNQMLTEMDGLDARKQVFIMGATNRPDIIDPAVLRPGRLDKILYIGLPTAEDRKDILKTLTKNGTKPSLSQDVDLGKIATDDRCQHFTGADLAALVREASVIALKKFMELSQPIVVNVSAEDFEAAFKKVHPSVSPKAQLMYENMKIRRSN